MKHFFRRTNPVLSELVKACGTSSTGQKSRSELIGAVLTINLDCLLQACDRACHGSPRILKTVERATKGPKEGKISLYHLHGYLRIEPKSPNAEAPDRLVFTEDEYLARNDDPYSWANVTLHGRCGSSACFLSAVR